MTFLAVCVPILRHKKKPSQKWEPGDWTSKRKNLLPDKLILIFEC